jgi:hypothetical protein
MEMRDLTRIYTSDRTPTAPPKIDLHRKLRPAALENTAHAAVVRLVHLEVLRKFVSPIIAQCVEENKKNKKNQQPSEQPNVCEAHRFLSFSF